MQLSHSKKRKKIFPQDIFLSVFHSHLVDPGRGTGLNVWHHQIQARVDALVPGKHGGVGPFPLSDVTLQPGH